MILQLLLSVLGGLGIGSLTSAVGVSVLYLLYRKPVINSFPGDEKEKIGRVLNIFSWVTLALVAGLLGFSAVYFKQQLLRRVFLQPAFLLAIVNLVIYAMAIAPPLAGIRDKLGETFPGYYKAVRNSAFVHYLAMNFSSGIVVALGTLAFSLIRSRALGFGAAALLASVGFGLVRLFTSVANSFSDLSRVQLYSDSNFKMGSDLHEFNEAVEKLVTRPFATWVLPLVFSVISFVIGGAIDAGQFLSSSN